MPRTIKHKNGVPVPTEPFAKGEQLRLVKARDFRVGDKVLKDLTDKHPREIKGIQDYSKTATFRTRHRLHNNSCRGLHVNGSDCYDYGSEWWITRG